MGLFGRGVGYLGLPLKANKHVRMILLLIVSALLIWYFSTQGNLTLIFITIGVAILLTALNYSLIN